MFLLSVSFVQPPLFCPESMKSLGIVRVIGRLCLLHAPFAVLLFTNMAVYVHVVRSDRHGPVHKALANSFLAHTLLPCHHDEIHVYKPDVGEIGKYRWDSQSTFKADSKDAGYFTFRYKNLMQRFRIWQAFNKI